MKDLKNLLALQASAVELAGSTVPRSRSRWPSRAQPVLRRMNRPTCTTTFGTFTTLVSNPSHTTASRADLDRPFHDRPCPQRSHGAVRLGSSWTASARRFSGWRSPTFSQRRDRLRETNRAGPAQRVGVRNARRPDQHRLHLGNGNSAQDAPGRALARHDLSIRKSWVLKTALSAQFTGGKPHD